MGHVFVRRLFYRWQFLAALVLPAWLFVGWGVFGPDGWPFLVLLVVCPVLAVALLVVGLLNLGRASSRQRRAVSWLDVALLAAWHAALVGVGFYGPANNWLILLSVLLGLTAFWASAWQLATDASRRVAGAFAALQTGGVATARPRPAWAARGESYIVVHETRTPDP